VCHLSATVRRAATFLQRIGDLMSPATASAMRMHIRMAGLRDVPAKPLAPSSTPLTLIMSARWWGCQSTNQAAQNDRTWSQLEIPTSLVISHIPALASPQPKCPSVPLLLGFYGAGLPSRVPQSGGAYPRPRRLGLQIPSSPTRSRHSKPNQTSHEPPQAEPFLVVWKLSPPSLAVVGFPPLVRRQTLAREETSRPSALLPLPIPDESYRQRT
jgi:hypothetical protein